MNTQTQHQMTMQRPVRGLSLLARTLWSSLQFLAQCHGRPGHRPNVDYAYWEHVYNIRGGNP